VSTTETAQKTSLILLMLG